MKEIKSTFVHKEFSKEERFCVTVEIQIIERFSGDIRSLLSIKSKLDKINSIKRLVVDELSPDGRNMASAFNPESTLHKVKVAGSEDFVRTSFDGRFDEIVVPMLKYFEEEK
ncbi:MAG: hypothetical protein KBT89_17085 [Gammaproteobacteria bacterium]|nr:hypothetical protein [Gammaproteobacteria bacterium]